jgi:hypothetical protein
MKRIIRYFTRWAWAPVLKEFVLRQKRAEQEALRISSHANHLFTALDSIANGKSKMPPVLLARLALTIKEGKQ